MLWQRSRSNSEHILDVKDQDYKDDYDYGADECHVGVSGWEKKKADSRRRTLVESL